MPFSERVTEDKFASIQINEVPEGSWYSNKDNTIIVGVTTRSCFRVFLVPFAIIWSSMAMFGTFGVQFLEGFELGFFLLGFVFLVPSLALWYITLFTIFGRVEVKLNQTEGTLFRGFWRIGRTKHFTRKDIRSILEIETRGRRGGIYTAILIKAKKEIEFGSGLTDARRHFMLTILQQWKALS